MMCLFSETQQKIIREYSGGMAYQSIADALNKKFHTTFTKNQIRSFCYYRGIITKTRKYFSLSKEMTIFLKENIKGKPINELLQLTNEKFGTNLSKMQIKNCIKRLKIKCGKGGGAWHLPIGTERTHTSGYVLIKIPNSKYFVRKHCYIWEQAHGKIPEGHNVIFLDGNKLNCELNNLALVTDGELGAMNRLNLRFNDKEFTKIGLTIAKHRTAIYDIATKGMSKKQRQNRINSLNRRLIINEGNTVKR
jgi:hypothetical protein